MVDSVFSPSEVGKISTRISQRLIWLKEATSLYWLYILEAGELYPQRKYKHLAEIVMSSKLFQTQCKKQCCSFDVLSIASGSTLCCAKRHSKDALTNENGGTRNVDTVNYFRSEPRYSSQIVNTSLRPFSSHCLIYKKYMSVLKKF